MIGQRTTLAMAARDAWAADGVASGEDDGDIAAAAAPLLGRAGGDIGLSLLRHDRSPRACAWPRGCRINSRFWRVLYLANQSHRPARALQNPKAATTERPRWACHGGDRRHHPPDNGA